MPVCSKTYTVYTFDYGRGTAEAVHSHGHQLEAELGYVDQNTFSNLFEGPAHPGGTSVTSRCGSVHNPPNSVADYDYADAAPQSSDCPAWFPDQTGPTSRISYADWGCTDVSDDSDNSQLNYLVWWMQNFPGRGNNVVLGGYHMRNWWEVHADFDNVVSSDKRLTLTSYPCLAFSCDNLLATATADQAGGGSCYTDPTTVPSTKVTVADGTLDLRAGPACSTRYARFVPSSSGGVYYLWAGRQTPGFNAVGLEFTGTSGSKYFSDQVYATGPAHACVLKWNGSVWQGPYCTPFG